MPGKVNPVIPEAVAMVAAQVMGHDAAIAIAGQSGNFQLNVMLPLIASNLLASIQLLTNAASALATQCLAGAEPNVTRLNEALARNPILATALNPVIGYERAAAIAKRAYAGGDRCSKSHWKCPVSARTSCRGCSIRRHLRAVVCTAAVAKVEDMC
jgi:fumarate hydratase class II